MSDPSGYLSACDQTCLSNVASLLDVMNRNDAPLYMYRDEFKFASSGLVNILPSLYTAMTSEQLYNLTMSQIKISFPNAS